MRQGRGPAESAAAEGWSGAEAVQKVAKARMRIIMKSAIAPAKGIVYDVLHPRVVTKLAEALDAQKLRWNWSAH
jgi:hypothetical protein